MGWEWLVDTCSSILSDPWRSFESDLFFCQHPSIRGVATAGGLAGAFPQLLKTCFCAALVTLQSPRPTHKDLIIHPWITSGHPCVVLWQPWFSRVLHGKVGQQLGDSYIVFAFFRGFFLHDSGRTGTCSWLGNHL